MTKNEQVVMEILNILDIHPSSEEYQKLIALVKETIDEAEKGEFQRGYRKGVDSMEPNWIC